MGSNRFPVFRLLIIMMSNAVFAGMSACCAQEPVEEVAVPESVLRFLDQKTQIAGWIEAAKLDLDGLSGIGIDVPGQVVQTRDALVQLGVRRVYWISDISGLTNGPQALIIPVPAGQKEVVRIVLDAFGGTLQGKAEGEITAVLADDVIVVGHPAGVRQLQEGRKGDPAPEFLDAIRRVRETHALVVATPVAAVLPMISLLPKLPGADEQRAARAAELLVNVRFVTVAGDNPSSGFSVRVTTASAETAAQLTELLNDWAADALGDRVQGRQATADGNELQVQIRITDLEPLMESGRRSVAMNSLKQLALALHNFYDVYQHFPPQSLADANGRRLLSWRVLILPYLGQQALYSEFRLNEPWDSEHNRRLISRMPDVFLSRNASGKTLEKGRTRFVTPLTASSVFGRSGPGTAFREITDGTSNTLMVVETTIDKAVVWTQPEDLLMDPDHPLSSVLDPSADGFLASLCDGSVRFFSKTLSPDLLKALLSMNGGEVIDWQKVE